MEVTLDPVQHFIYSELPNQHAVQRNVAVQLNAIHITDLVKELNDGLRAARLTIIFSKSHFVMLLTLV
jgi:hypothetical protein